MNYNKICGFTPHFGRQHRDFIKIMIKYEECKQLIFSTKPILFIPTNPRMISQVQAQRGGNQSLNLTSYPPQKSKEEDSIGVLTVPNDFKKK